MGSYVIWTAVAGARYSIEQIKKRRVSILFGQISKWCAIVIKSSALLSIWVRIILVRFSTSTLPSNAFCFGLCQCYDQCLHFVFFLQIFVIPVLIGLLFELLVIVPMRVPVDESPVFLLYQDWALGLIFLKIWTRLVSFSLL